MDNSRAKAVSWRRSHRFLREQIMPVFITWQDISLRLILTVAAGLIIGSNRTERGRAAGMRTTILVCLAASLSMIEANLLMNTTGRVANSFVQFDVMRLPLGILSGMGFIGAGTILRKDNLVVGVTTAATLWYSTMMGLCFGGGQTGLGIAALVLGWGTLWGLTFVERHLRQDTLGMLTLSVSKNGPTEEEIRATIARSGCVVLAWGVAYTNYGESREVRGEIQRRAVPRDSRPPSFVAQLAENAHVKRIEWRPQGISSGSNAPDPGPFAGLPGAQG
jgi:putative Mg2+ transporter-C (MgtC) family protein